MASKLINVVTPVGELMHVNITGQGKENYNEDGYEYVANIRMPAAAAKPLMDAIEECLGEVPKGKTVKSRGYRELLIDKDEDGNEQLYFPTSKTKESGRDEKAKKSGIIQFAFKTVTAFPDGKPKKVGVYNSAKPPTKLNMGDKLIGNGSKGAISGKMQHVERGKEVMVSLYLNAIQLVDFVEYSGDAGFEGHDDGFTGFSDDMPEAEAPPSKEEADAPKQTSKPKL